MADPRLLVTGCGRSGTGYLATLLTELGLPCGHEEVFNPATLMDGQGFVDWPVRRPGEASWLAAPYIDRMPAETVVVHQVREPLAVVRSFLRIRFFETESRYRELAEIHEPGLTLGTVVEKCLTYWLRWNRRVEEAAGRAGLEYSRHRLEDLDAGVLRQILDDFDVEVSERELVERLRAHPTDYNSRGDRSADTLFRWEDLPQGDLTRDVLSLARRYGYRAAEEAASGA